MANSIGLFEEFCKCYRPITCWIWELCKIYLNHNQWKRKHLLDLLYCHRKCNANEKGSQIHVLFMCLLQKLKIFLNSSLTCHLWNTLLALWVLFWNICPTFCRSVISYSFYYKYCCLVTINALIFVRQEWSILFL